MAKTLMYRCGVINISISIPRILNPSFLKRQTVSAVHDCNVHHFHSIENMDFDVLRFAEAFPIHSLI